MDELTRPGPPLQAGRSIAPNERSGGMEKNVALTSVLSRARRGENFRRSVILSPSKGGLSYPLSRLRARVRVRASCFLPPLPTWEGEEGGESVASWRLPVFPVTNNPPSNSLPIWEGGLARHPEPVEGWPALSPLPAPGARLRARVRVRASCLPPLPDWERVGVRVVRSSIDN